MTTEAVKAWLLLHFVLGTTSGTTQVALDWVRYHKWFWESNPTCKGFAKPTFVLFIPLD